MSINLPMTRVVKKKERGKDLRPGGEREKERESSKKRREKRETPGAGSTFYL